MTIGGVMVAFGQVCDHAMTLEDIMAVRGIGVIGCRVGSFITKIA